MGALAILLKDLVTGGNPRDAINKDAHVAGTLHLHRNKQDMFMLKQHTNNMSLTHKLISTYQKSAKVFLGIHLVC